MKILYDGDLYNWQKAGGINRYFERIISLLPADFESHLLTFERHAENWPSHPKLHVHQAPLFQPQRVARRLGRYYFGWRSRQLQPHIVHPTYFFTLSMLPLNEFGCPSVLTIYDFIMDIFSDQLDASRHLAHQQKRAIEAADALICISQNTRNDLLNRFPHLESRVTVTPLAGDLSLQMAYGPEKTPERPYFLFVGSRAPYKNFGGLLHAMAPLVASIPDVCVAVVGKPFDSSEEKLINELGLENHIENWGRLPDQHLAKMYRLSLGLVYPSFYEGFGIPPLEAMNCQTLAVVANTSSLPEVVGDAAFLFDPSNINQLSEILYSIARDEVHRPTWLAKGQAQANRFSWQRTADQTAEIYRSLAKI